MVVARVEGVATREAAAALTGVELFARRAQLPPPDADEFYHDDLVGLEAVTPEGVALGRVLRVVNHGAGDILGNRAAGGRRDAAAAVHPSGCAGDRFRRRPDRHQLAAGDRRRAAAVKLTCVGSHGSDEISCRR